MAENLHAKRFLVSGMVQGVGFRFFAIRVAEQLGVAGYVKNLRDGRVEVYAVASRARLQALRGELERGPRAAQVLSVQELEAAVDARYAGSFSVEYDR